MRVTIPYEYDFPDDDDKSCAKIKALIFLPALLLLACMDVFIFAYKILPPPLPAILGGLTGYSFFMMVDGLSVIDKSQVSPSRFPGKLKIFTSMGAGPLNIYVNILTLGLPVIFTVMGIVSGR